MDTETLELVELEIARLVRRVASFSFDKNGASLDRSAYLLLYRITKRGAAGVKTLADELRLDISTVSRQTAALEQKGLVVRKPVPLDRRAYVLEITPLGTSELAAFKQVRLQAIAGIMQDWSEEERAQFGTLLGKFNRSLSKLSDSRG
ncbi:MarR family winged helix-turn-helix transcriptional regulator [Paenibacillus cymbidii]|uniref:MarR family winged helix-turn-helix transcriptional regulator n=1 Tax=Paenibacillus cymbidii TaxID=1639034 RepID=UPI001080081B|nr:MarR family transcriptional regulator [Paenibacillus cymbidii]